jgi:hypothetical protein
MLAQWCALRAIGSGLKIAIRSVQKTSVQAKGQDMGIASYIREIGRGKEAHARFPRRKPMT